MRGRRRLCADAPRRAWRADAALPRQRGARLMRRAKSLFDEDAAFTRCARQRGP